MVDVVFYRFSLGLIDKDSTISDADEGEDGDNCLLLSMYHFHFRSWDPGTWRQQTQVSLVCLFHHRTSTTKSGPGWSGPQFIQQYQIAPWLGAGKRGRVFFTVSFWSRAYISLNKEKQRWQRSWFKYHGITHHTTTSEFINFFLSAICHRSTAREDNIF